MKRRDFRPRVVDLAFCALALLCVWVTATIPPLIGKVLFGYFAAACVTGLIFRWGWLLPSTLITFLTLQTLQPAYAHSAEEAVWHDLIHPTIGAAIVAALQIAFSWLNSDDASPSKSRPDGGTPPERPQ